MDKDLPKKTPEDLTSQLDIFRGQVDAETRRVKIYSSECTTLQKKLWSSQLRNQELCAEVESYKAEANRLQIEIGQCKRKLLKTLLNLELARTERDGLERQNRQYAEELSEAKLVVVQLTAEKDGLKHQTEQYAQELSEARMAIGQLAAEKDGLKHQTEQYTQELSEARMAIGQLAAEKDGLKHQIEQYMQELSEARMAIDQLAAERESLKHQTVQYTQELSEAHRTIYQLAAEKDGLKHQNEQYTQELSEARIAVDQLTAERESLKHQTVQYTQELSEAHQTIYQLAAEKDGLKYQNEQFTQELSEAHLTIGQLAAEKESLKFQNEQCNGTIAQSHQTIGQLAAEINGLRSQLAPYGPVRWATWLIPQWRQYYWEHYADIHAKLKDLKDGLDKVSLETIDMLCNRNFILLPPKADDSKFLYRYDDFYAPWELEGFAHEEEYRQTFISKFRIPDSPNCFVETTTVEFYNGLKCIPQEIQDRLRNSHIIDGGACWGDSMLVFSEYGPKTIHCFEPDRHNFNLLEETVGINHMTQNVHLIKKGLFSKQKKAQLYSIGFSTCNTINTSVLEEMSSTGEESIELTSIDSYVEEQNISVGMIKLDVEGAELAAIQGAQQTICRDKPILLVSVYHTPEDFFEIKPLIESWNLGYHFMIRKTTYRDLVAEVMLIGYVDDRKK